MNYYYLLKLTLKFNEVVKADMIDFPPTMMEQEANWRDSVSSLIWPVISQLLQ